MTQVIEAGDLSSEAQAALFPSYAADEAVPERLVELVNFSDSIDVPFPAEPNPNYAVWWRSLHEIAHWAVKPAWYTETDFGGRQIPILTTPLRSEEDAKQVRYYSAGNDIIPDAELPEGVDPTANEFEVRPWTIRTMAALGYDHPFLAILRQGQTYEDVSDLKDAGWHKPASMRVWAPTSQLRPESVRSMAYYGIDPLQGHYRADGKDFSVPHPSPNSLDQIQHNVQAMVTAYQALGELALPALTEPDHQASQLYHRTYKEWVLETKNGAFSLELQERLATQLEEVLAYCSTRFSSLFVEVLAALDDQPAV